MFAYVFWHAKPAGVAAAEYEKSLLHFGRALPKAKIPGLLDNASYSVELTPWLGETGYEDWAWVDKLSVFETLNERAVSGVMEESHTGIAQMTKHGGLGAFYYLVAGEHQTMDDSRVCWLSRPRGVNWRDVMPGIIESAGTGVSVWRRFMVLGPAPEFAIVGPSSLSLTLPEGWGSLEINRRRIK